MATGRKGAWLGANKLTAIASILLAGFPADDSASGGLSLEDVAQYVFPFVDVSKAPYSASPTTSSVTNRIDIQAAVNAVVSLGHGTVFVPPVGDYYINGDGGGDGIDLSAMPEGSAFIGGGAKSGLRANGASITGVMVKFDQGNDTYKKSVRIENFMIRGAMGTALYVRGLTEGAVRDVVVRDGSMGVSFDFDDCYGCEFSNLFAKTATCSIANFRTGGSFNANDCRNWYTSASTPINILIDSDFGKGNSFTMMTVQGGTVGLEVREMSGSSFNGFYSENVGTAIKLGDEATSKLASGLHFSSVLLYGRATQVSGETLRAAINAELCEFCTFDTPYFQAISASFTVYVADTGTERPAAVAVLKDDGLGSGFSVSSVEVLCPGAGLPSAPAVTVSASGGSGFAATASESGGAVTSVSVDTAGSGYTSHGNPIAVEYKNARGLRFINPRVRSGTPVHTGDNVWMDFPLYPFVMRSPGANNKSYVTIEDDRSMHDSASFPTTLTMRKKAGDTPDHILEYRDASGALQTITRTVPVYPA
ncbi:MAG: hypothetical protein ACRBC3_19645 [Burkholderiaceae bacterium]